MKLLADFFPIILFFIAFKTHGMFVATGVAIAASVIQVAWAHFKHGKVETNHWVTLGMIVVFGGLTLLFQDKTFIMWKPTALNWLFALIFLGSQFIGQKNLAERLMGGSISVPKPIWLRLNLSWVVFFILIGFANLYMAERYFSAATEVNAVASVPLDQLEEGQACTELYDGSALPLCEQAREMESQWVDFKLFGVLGLTFAFVLAQAFYMARHVKDKDDAPTPET